MPPLTDGESRADLSMGQRKSLAKVDRRDRTNAWQLCFSDSIERHVGTDLARRSK